MSFNKNSFGAVMYHHELKIVLFTRNDMLEREIRALESQEGFTHNISVSAEYDPLALDGAEIVIVDAPLQQSFMELRELLGKECQIIAIMSDADELALSDEEIAVLDDVWLSPPQPPRIRLRMKTILQNIKRDADGRVHLIWLDTLMDSMPDLVWFKDLEGVHHKVNARFCEFVKKDRAMVLGEKHSRIWDTEDDDESCRDSEEAAISTGQTILTDEIVKIGDEQHLFKTYKTPLRGPKGEIIGTVGFGHDLTNLLNLDMELKFFIESMPFPLLICNDKNEIRQVNGRFIEYFAADPGRLIGMPFDSWQEQMFQKETSPVNGEHYLRFADKNHRMRYVTMTRKRIMDIFGKKVGSVNIYRDITAEKELENRIWRDANTDGLTGLANRHAFDAYVKKLAPESHIHLCYIDLDAFKSVNDRYGHKAGDEALKIVAKSIRNVFAQDFPARLGGDEFLICVQRELPLSELERLANRFLQRLHEKLGADPQLCGITGSIGIRAGGKISDTVDRLIRQADIAMYRAKANGKGRYCIWNEEMGEMASR